MRLFTFGCSFTNGKNPTWADILGREFGQFQNWGRGGAGNGFIFHSLTECIRRNKLNPEDTVIIMWTSIGREDRFVNGHWITPGTIYNQDIYDKSFVEKFADPTGYLLRDMAHLSAARMLLDKVGCAYYFLSMIPFDVFDDNTCEIMDTSDKILELYKDELKHVRPSMYEVVFEHDWYSRIGIIDPVEVKRQYDSMMGVDWPTWQEFLDGKISRHTRKELAELGFFIKTQIRTDTHPTPIEHLEYLDRVLPEIDLQDTTREWVYDIDSCLRKLQPIPQWRRARQPVRF